MPEKLLEFASTEERFTRWPVFVDEKPFLGDLILALTRLAGKLKLDW